MDTTPGAVSQSDRDTAITVVKLACDEGLIIAADRDARIQQLKNAQSHAEIDLAVGNLKSRLQDAGTPGPTVGVAATAATTPVAVPDTLLQTMSEPLGDTSPGRSWPFASLVGGLVAVVAGIALVIFVVSLLSGVDFGGGDSADPSNPGNPSSGPENQGKSAVLTQPGFKALLAAIKEETGRTVVFEAVLYPEYAVLELPVDLETKRESRYYWDGKELKAYDSFGKSSDARFDLSTINVAGMLRLSQKVREIIEEPTSYYVIVNAPDEFDAAVMFAYASNKYSEGGYLSADADGKQIRKVTW